VRLKKLVIIGFKSFADKTVLNFDAGISCIVGPNGCGKSNIADAFRWVLGEQSAKSMRGNKMPDVIFAGTNHRKPLNFAEVSLTMTDIQGALPIEYEEVTITRRLHRSGESEYFLNNNPVRLKDLQNLFLDSGVGRHAFSIFEQGKLDQVISNTPIERRHIFEEAAGINRFLQRKREALKRLEQADQNWSRLKDIHQEVEKQIRTLQVQAEKAVQYKENKILFERLEKASYVLRWQGLDQKIQSVESRNQQLETKLDSLKASYAAWQEKNHAAKAEIQNHELSLRAKSEDLYKIRNVREIQLRDKETLQERLVEAQQKEKKLKRELEELALTRNTRLKELQEIEKKTKEIDSEYSDAEKKVTHQNDRVKQKEKVVLNLRQDLHVKQQAHLKAMQLESQIASEMKQMEIRLENSHDKQRQLQERKQFIVEDLKAIVKTIQEKKNILQDASSLVDAHKEKLEHYEDKLKELAQESALKQKAMENLQSQMMESKARVNVLLRMRKDHEGFSSGSKFLLQASQNQEGPLFGLLRPLYEFMEPEAEASEAVATILRTYSDTLVVDTKKNLNSVIDYAVKEGINDYSLVCKELIEKGQDKSGKKGKTVYDLVRHNTIAEHFLSDVITVKSHVEIVDLFEQNSIKAGWSSEGAFVDQRGVFFRLKPSANQVFMREAELKTLEEELLSKEEGIEALQKQIQLQHKQKGELQLHRAELDQIVRRDEMKLVEVNFGLQRALADQDKFLSIEKQNDQEMLTLQNHSEELKSQVKILQTKHHTFQQDLKKLQEGKEDLQQDLEKQEAGLRILLQDHKETGDHFHQIHETKTQLQHQQNLLAVKEQDREHNKQRMMDELEEAIELQSHFSTKEKEIQKMLATLEKDVEATEEVCSTLEKALKSKKTALSDIEKEMVRQQDTIREIETENTQKQIQLAHHQAAAQSLISELLERYQLSIEEAQTEILPLEQSLDQIEKQMRSLRHSLQQISDINLASIEDLEKQQTRYSFLGKQMEDMYSSKQELLQIITELDGESRKLFKETFDAVRANFKKNFQILFNGGEADLQFTESEDILEAGIEISAQPPGKQMRSITLLSGGEKCLTAVALLFAIFEVKSSPFCILDEIDAPLDDANVDRFVNVVKHFVGRCQFLIITHNKRTMSIGDVLFGVSMEEKGVSKLLSLEFSHEPLPDVALV